MIEAVLFDNDGVLVETEQLYFEAARVALGELGIDLSLGTYQDVSLRRGRSVMDLAAEHGADAAEIEALRETRDRRYAEFLERGIAPIPGVRDTVDRLREDGKRLAIVTTCPGKHFEIQHRATKLLPLFDLVLVREDYQRSKPFPDPYSTAVRRLGLDPSCCVAIEDTQRGIDSATAAGVPCFAVASPMTRGVGFEGALAVLDAISELPEAVRRLEAN